MQRSTRKWPHLLSRWPSQGEGSRTPSWCPPRGTVDTSGGSSRLSQLNTHSLRRFSLENLFLTNPSNMDAIGSILKCSLIKNCFKGFRFTTGRLRPSLWATTKRTYKPWVPIQRLYWVNCFDNRSFTSRHSTVSCVQMLDRTCCIGVVVSSN